MKLARLFSMFAIFSALARISFSSTDDPDFIVIGVGTSGAVLAAELSSNPAVKVLALERGDDNSQVTSTSVWIWDDVVIGANLAETRDKQVFVDHHYSQESNFGFRSQYFPSPNLFGGGSSVNNNVYSKVSALDLMSWNNSEWTFEKTLPASKEIERCVGCDSAYHGMNGPIVTNNFHSPTDTSAIMEAMASVFNVNADGDLNDGSSAGIGWMYRNLDLLNEKPVRQDSYSKFLKPVLRRKNLVVHSGALVLSIQLNKGGGPTVKYNWRGTVQSATATKEVILSAGALHSPRLLMLSGIGDCHALRQLKIPCQVNNPQVGKNLKDSIANTMVFSSPPTTTQRGAIGVTYYKSPNYSGERTDMELAFGSIAPEGNATLFFMTQLLHDSNGEIKLRSANPYVPPLFSFNFPTDMSPLVDQFKKIRAVANTVGGMIDLDPLTRNLPDDNKTIADYLSNRVTALYHVVGACSLNKVVDGRLRLIDAHNTVVPGIRIADNSIIPTLLSTHSTCSTAMLIGKRCAMMVKEDWKIP